MKPKKPPKSPKKKQQQPQQQKSILAPLPKYTNVIQVMYHGNDVTPSHILPQSYKGGKERQMNVYDIQDVYKATSSSSNGTATISKLFKTDSTMLTRLQPTDLARKGNESMYFTAYGYSELATMDEFESFEEPADGGGSGDESSEESLAPEIVGPMPPTVTLTLYETDTIFILDIASSTVEKETPEGAKAEEDNKYYEYITTGRGKNRKVIDSQVQTVPQFAKTVATQARLPRHVHHHTFASLWDMHDTFLRQSTVDPSLTPSDAPAGQADQQQSYESLSSREEQELKQLFRNPKFLEVMCVMQRILANNVYNKQQKRFRGLSDPSAFREDIEYNYTLNLLWTFANDDTKGRCVTALSWNPANRDVLAVGYGKFYYDDETTGLVLVWNIKNPVQPERHYAFQFPVTSLNFSRQRPNYLAVGFYTGDIEVIDIASRSVVIVAAIDRQTSKLYEPIWQIEWYIDHDYYEGVEFLATTCQNGKIGKLRPNYQSGILTYHHLMQVSNAEGKLKGIETLRKCPSKSIPISRHSPALTFTPHPTEPNIYYIGTGDGVVHKCSKNYYHQHLDLFLAHDGPLYAVAFSPFCGKMFLTCGDDWAIRLWVDGVSEPLFEIKKRMAGVQGVAWSPSHSTIIASISGQEIFVWDLQRKTYDSQSATVNPSKARNTLLKFTDDGRCLLVADIDGNVHVFSLEDMPFPAFFQENLLTESIKRSLITRPDLLNRIDKIVNLNLTSRDFS